MLRQFKPFETTLNFEFKDPDTAFIYKADKLTDLYKNIILYREQNRLEPIENLRDVVENYLCGLPENCNKCTPKELKRSFMMYVKGGIVLVRNMAFKMFVPQSVANKRAEQCLKCKYNIFPDKGPFISFADNLAMQQVGERKSPYDSVLGQCGVCTCILKSKIHQGGSFPKPTDEELVKFKEVNCWQLEVMKK